jgi:transposase
MDGNDLTDREWNAIRRFLPQRKPGKAGRPWTDHRQVLNAILWILRAGAPWRGVPNCYGKWKTIYNRFWRWRKDGTWDRIWETLLAQQDQAGEISRELWCVDGTVVRAHRCAAGSTNQDPEEPENHALGRSRGGFSTKLHVVTDDNGVVVAVSATAGQQGEAPEFPRVMEAVPIARLDSTSGAARRRFPKSVAGDKAYSSAAIRNWLQNRGIRSVIPTRRDERKRRFSRATYKKRNIVERAIGRLKEHRRIATRYEKNGSHYLAMVKIALIRQLLD